MTLFAGAQIQAGHLLAKAPNVGPDPIDGAVYAAEVCASKRGENATVEDIAKVAVIAYLRLTDRDGEAAALTSA